MKALTRATMIASMNASWLFALLGADGARAESVPGSSSCDPPRVDEQEVAAVADSVPLAAGISDHALGFHMSIEPAFAAALAMLGCVIGWASTRHRVLRRGRYAK